MIAYPAISPLTGDRRALQQLIGMTGLGDRHHPDSLIEITGMRILDEPGIQDSLYPEGLSRPGDHRRCRRPGNAGLDSRRA
jgi:hypothetical protein